VLNIWDLDLDSIIPISISLEISIYVSRIHVNTPGMNMHSWISPNPNHLFVRPLQTKIQPKHTVIKNFGIELPWWVTNLNYPKNALKWLSTRSFGGNYRNFGSKIRDIWLPKLRVLYFFCKIPTEASEERKPCRWKRNYCVDAVFLRLLFAISSFLESYG
jgi:hypothetical protein